MERNTDTQGDASRTRIEAVNWIFEVKVDGRHVGYYTHRKDAERAALEFCEANPREDD